MIHRYKMGGLNIVFDSSAGKGHIVDDIAYDVIGMFEAYDEEEVVSAMTERHGWRAGVDEGDIEECYERIRELKEKGHLFAPDEDAAADPGRKDCSLILLMEDSGTAMDFDTGCRALNELMKRSGKGACLSVEFRCGSPDEGADMIERLIGYARREGRARGRTFQFLKTVNGVLTDECMAGSTGCSAINELRFAGRGRVVRICGGKNGFPFARIDAGRLGELKDLMEADDGLFRDRLNSLIQRDGGSVFSFYHYIVDYPQERILMVSPGGDLSVGGVCRKIIGNVWDDVQAGRTESTPGGNPEGCMTGSTDASCGKADGRCSGGFGERTERRIVLDMINALAAGSGREISSL